MNDAERKIYTELVNFLGKALGPHTEIVLQDISQQNIGIVAIANGHISGRKVGDGPSDFIIQMVNNKEYRDYHRLNFSTVGHDGRTLRSSIYFIRDEQKNLTGMLCLNTDISSYLNICDQIKNLAGLDFINDGEIGAPHALPDSQDIYLISTKEVILENIHSILREMNIDIPLRRLNAREKQDIVVKLQERGVFNLKGAVAEIANCMEVSEPSIYRYLNKSGG